MKRLLLASAFGVSGLVMAPPANAQLAARPDWNYSDDAPQPYNDLRRVAYDNGYREGVKEGEKDGRSRNVYDFRDERAWQRGDKGYHRSYGDEWRYQQSFRGGFEAGYSIGYRRYAGNYGYGGGYGTRAPGGVYPNTRGDYPSPRGDYGNGYPRGGYGGGYSYSPGYSNGVNDGYQKGREDARDRHSFDPRRHSWYRSGDRNYRNEYGPRREYEDLYRQGFQEGYARGYRESGYRW
jgi:hypothetical protein